MQNNPLAPLVYAILGYFVLQIVLNLILRFWLKRSGKTAGDMLKATFWGGVVNGMYFIAAAVTIYALHLAPQESPKLAYSWLALAGVPAGWVLWYLSVLGRKMGLELFGRGEIIAAEDAILRIGPSRAFTQIGLFNVTIIQPFGRELFMRGIYFPLLIDAYGIWMAVLATLVFEFFTKLNVVWLFQTALYTGFVCAAYWYTGSLITGLVAACVAGLIHGSALAYMAVRDAEAKEAKNSSP